MRNIRRSAATLVAVVGLAVALPAGVPAHASPSSTSTSVRAFDHKLLRMVNHARTAHGLKAYTFNSDLHGLAQSWSKKLAKDQALSHRPDLDAKVHALCSSKSSAGENVGWVEGAGAHKLFRLYMDDPAHKALILSARFTFVGIATHKLVKNGQPQEWNTMDFATHC